MNNQYENIIPWNGEKDTGRDARLKLQRNFEKVAANFEELLAKLSNFDSAFKLHYDDETDPKKLTSIEALAGLWSNGYLSTKGNNPDAGSGGGGGNISGIKVNGGTYTPDSDGYITIPNYPTSLTWGSISGKPTTLAGYGITDAYTKTVTDSTFAKKTDIPSLSGYATQSWVNQQLDDYVLKSTYTASDILSKLKTVDGTGSGLDADRVDGFDATEFVKRYTAGYLSAVDWNTLKENYLYSVRQENWGTDNTPDGPYEYGMLAVLKGYNTVTQLYIPHGTDGVWYRQTWSGDDSQWRAWTKLATRADNVASATKLETTRTIWGQSFNGEGNVSGSLTGVVDIHMSGMLYAGSSIVLPYTGTSWLQLATREDVIRGSVQQKSDEAHGLYRVTTSSGHRVAFGGLGNDVGFYGFYKSRIDAGTNGTDWQTFWDVSSGTLKHNRNMEVSGTATAGGFRSSSNTILSYAPYNSTEVIRYDWTDADRDHLTIKIPGTNDQSVFMRLSSGGTYAGLYVAGGIFSTTGVSTDGYVSAKGTNTSSDMRLKDVLREVSLSVQDIAKAPAVSFRWKNGGGNAIGSSAQYWRGLLPEAVRTNADGYLSMEYGNIALVSVIRLAREVIELRKKLDKYEKVYSMVGKSL